MILDNHSFSSSNGELSKVLASTSARKENHPLVKSYDVKGFYDTDVAEFKDYDPDSFGGYGGVILEAVIRVVNCCGRMLN